MKHLFIDTDVIFDFLTDRKPFSMEAAKLFSLIDQKIVKGYASSLSFSNLYYVLRKLGTHRKVMNKLQDLSDFIEILKVDGNTIKSALNSDFKDFEDAVQYFSAQENKQIECILTRNIKDYKDISLPVMTPETFLVIFENTAGQ